MIVRSVKSTDLSNWVKMRSDLWPNDLGQDLTELKEYFSGNSIDIVDTFVIQIENGELAGFIELNLRNFAEGSRSPRVPYIEAWYVKPEYRGKGYGRALMQKAESWSREKGFTEIASDTEINNQTGIALHKQFGFVETERVVCFLKQLKTDLEPDS